MSWLRNSSIGASLGKLRGTTSPSKDFDITACYDSFRKHWQQINDIIVRTRSGDKDKLVKSDDILAVVSNLDHMVTLLILELKQQQDSNNPCLEHVLSENLLDCLYEWSLSCGKFVMALKMEQLKLYEVLVSHSHTQLLVHEAFHRPLLRLLTGSSDPSFNEDLDKRLVVLLNQLCVSLVHHRELLQLFFHFDTKPSFIIFSLLIPFIHRDGAVGQQARDALLFCMSLSKQNENVARFIAHHSNVCPVLATGLSGLYSSLPCKHNIYFSTSTRLTPEDINETEELSCFMNSLEFCNAVLQVAHPIVCSHLLELLYRGFLVPVMGPALFQSSEPELTSATAYFDLFLRCLSEPGLIHSFIRFVFKESYDDQVIIDSLIHRIDTNGRLSVITLSLFETMISLNCEDIMLELVFKYLIPCNHVMASQKSRINSSLSYVKSAERLMNLSPVIERSEDVEESLYGNYLMYLCEARRNINSSSYATSVWEYSYDGESPTLSQLQNNVHFTETEFDSSMLSVDDVSSGYESFIKHGDFISEPGSGPESYSPTNSDICSGSKSTNNSYSSVPTVGPFIEALFSKLEKMTTLDIITILQLTGIISRLAVFPQPLLRSFLLDNSLVFQPSIKSLFQIVGLLKQKIEIGFRNTSNDELKYYIDECEAVLFDRERSFLSSHKQPTVNSLPANINNRNDSFERSDNKRKSLTASINAVFKRTTATIQPSSGTVKYSTKNPEIRRSVMCAILLNEWLRELAAISQEHAVFFLKVQNNV